MALKDWKGKKVRGGVLFQNKLMEYVAVFYSPITKLKNKWIVDIKGNIKSFKTKPKVIAYAKAYMRKH